VSWRLTSSSVLITTGDWPPVVSCGPTAIWMDDVRVGGTRRHINQLHHYTLHPFIESWHWAWEFGEWIEEILGVRVSWNNQLREIHTANIFQAREMWGALTLEWISPSPPWQLWIVLQATEQISKEAETEPRAAAPVRYHHKDKLCQGVVEIVAYPHHCLGWKPPHVISRSVFDHDYFKWLDPGVNWFKETNLVDFHQEDRTVKIKQFVIHLTVLNLNWCGQRC